MSDITDNERTALKWLLDGNGQKTVRSKDIADGPFAREHNNLRAMSGVLADRGLVVISGPDYFGNRWINITDAGRAALLERPRAKATRRGEP